MAERKNNGSSQRRVYKPTECILTSNVESGNVYAVGLYNMIAVHSVAVLPAILLNDSYKAGRLHLDLEGYYLVLGSAWEWLAVTAILFFEFLLSFFVYFSFLAWVVCYRRVGTAASYLFLLLLVACVLVSRRLVFVTVFDLELHAAGRITCCIQLLILCMKWISFIHENAYKVLYPWKKDDETGPAVWFEGQMEPQIGSFSSYVYFLFCPVLLYRDRYPRKPRNLYKAFSYFCQFVFLVWVCYVILFEFGMPQSMHRDDIRQVAVQNVFLGFLLLLCAHVFMLHCWTNCWAEITGFADCNFYEAWWNAESLLG
jgi:sterol O-acyltransferase